jgi:hypothetical protein
MTCRLGVYEGKGCCAAGKLCTLVGMVVEA